MSTIVAVEKSGRTVIAWESLITIGSDCTPNLARVSKVIRSGDGAIGAAGFSLYYTILPHYVRQSPPPAFRNEQEVFEYFLKFWRALREDYSMVDDQADQENKSPFADLDSEFLVCGVGGMFRVKEILSVSLFNRFCAIGTGASHAEGALEILYPGVEDPVAIATQAVAVACRYDRASGGDICHLELGKTKRSRRRTQ